MNKLKEKFYKELDKILKDKRTSYGKYGDKCPYCDFKVPEYYHERNKPMSLAVHMGSMHKEKLVNKGMRIKNLVFNIYIPAILKEYTKSFEELLRSFGEKEIFTINPIILELQTHQKEFITTLQEEK